MPLKFRGTADLHHYVLRGLPLLPPDLDLVVAVPRSGFIPASLISTYLDLPLTDVDGFLAGHLLRSASRSEVADATSPSGRDVVRRARSVLIIDDSVGHGTEMRRVRQRLEAAAEGRSLHFATVFANPAAASVVDVAFEFLPTGRYFSWNAMHHDGLSTAGIDADGLLWAAGGAPADRAPPLIWRPSVEVGWIVTRRGEAERKVTEAWLASHEIRFQRLVMPASTLASRAEEVTFKARAYRQSGSHLMLTDAREQAETIAARTGLPVLAVSAQRMSTPSLRARAMRVIGETVSRRR